MRWSVQDFRNKTDEELAAIAQSGGEGAEEELLNRYKSAVRARARKFFLTGGETEDLAQEGMIGLVSAIRDFRADGGKSFKNFAYLCVSRRIYSALRAAGRTPEYDDLDPDSVSEGATPEDFVLAGESLAEFRTKLTGTLSDFEFRVVSLWLDGMSYAAIAQATGKDLKAVDNALSRSRKKLQTAFVAGRKKEN